MPTQHTTPPIDYVKDIRRNKETRDWDAYITYMATGKSEYLGSEPRRQDAESLVDHHVYQLCKAGLL